MTRAVFNCQIWNFMPTIHHRIRRLLSGYNESFCLILKQNLKIFSKYVFCDNSFMLLWVLWHKIRCCKWCKGVYRCFTVKDCNLITNLRMFDPFIVASNHWTGVLSTTFDDCQHLMNVCEGEVVNDAQSPEKRIYSMSAIHKQQHHKTRSMAVPL